MNREVDESCLTSIGSWPAGETLPSMADLPRIPTARAIPVEVGQVIAELAAVRNVTPAYDSEKPPKFEGFEIECELGSGGMGTVYRARQSSVDRLVALKVFRGNTNPKSSERSRFQLEVEAIARLQHAHIVQIFDAGEQHGCPYFCMELMEGTLSERLSATPLAPKSAAGLLSSLAQAIQFAHDQGIVHRDLKPGNILLSANGTPKVADFGLAKQERTESGQTETGDMLGTPLYMAPEQITGNSGPSVDIYALGTILYESLTGRTPFRGVTTLETLQQVATWEPVPPSRFQPAVPRDLETICLKCLEKDPSRRFATAGELAEDLARFLDGKPIRARRVGVMERGGKWVKRQPMTAALVSLMIVSAIAFLAAILWKNSELHSAARRERGLALSARVAQEAAERNAIEAQEQRRQAEANLERARVAARRSMLVARSLSQHADTSKLQFELLEEALGVYQQLASSNDPAVRHETAKTHFTLAYGLGCQGQGKKSEELFAKATSQLEALIRDYPEHRVYQHDLAVCYGRRAKVLYESDPRRLSEAENLLRQSCGMLDSLCRGPCAELNRHRKWLDATLRALETRRLASGSPPPSERLASAAGK